MHIVWKSCEDVGLRTSEKVFLREIKKKKARSQALAKLYSTIRTDMTER